ncbi:hypothetical protein [Burkholderia guangdongensis]|uniref:hypothetical protein n=1 Tax=Burkholderia guangdongensis TaxID=1792500 RepID=UPI0015C8B0F5|nr:hypothetical protein [Burkholderia guangdongensis]
MAFNFYAGQTFNGAGNLAFVGNFTPGYYGTYGVTGNQPDFSQWVISASLYDATGQTLIYNFKVTNLSDPALPNTNGLYMITAISGDTAQWVIGKAQFVVKAVAADGSEILGEPIWYRIVKHPMT